MALQFTLPCDADAAQARLSDPDFVVQRAIDLGELAADAELVEDDEVVKLVQRRRAYRVLPNAVRLLVSAEMEMTVTETWSAFEDGSWSCEQIAEIEDQPITIFGDIQLLPADDGCLYRIEQRVRATILILGPTIQNYVLGEAQKAMERELGYLKQSL